MTRIVLSGSGFTIADLAAIANGDAAVEAGPGVYARLVDARRVLEAVAASGQQIYGMNTGLGGNVKTAVTADFEAFQLQLVRGRDMGLGTPLPRAATRAVMAARLSMFAVGGSGISPAVFDALLALLNAKVHPLIPSIGSIGAGDLVLLSSLAQVLVGEGSAEYHGVVYPAAEALALAGLSQTVLQPKDGISLLNASAVSVGCGALVLNKARRLFDFQRQAAALSFEGIGGNPDIFSPAIQAARPAAGQADEAAWMLEALTGSSLIDAKTTLQDPLSFRCIASIQGALGDALAHAQAIAETELNSAADNPLVVPEEDRVLSTGNFHTPSLSLAFETLGLAIAQAASASAARFVQLTGSGRNGLPRYLSPVGGASAGFVPMQKTVSALLSAIRHKANPVMLDFLAVSEGVEDHATQSTLTVQKCLEMVDLWCQIIACELVAAAQAVDLRPGHRCGVKTLQIYKRVRQQAAVLNEDRSLSGDVSAVIDDLLANL